MRGPWREGTGQKGPCRASHSPDIPHQEHAPSQCTYASSANTYTCAETPTPCTPGPEPLTHTHSQQKSPHDTGNPIHTSAQNTHKCTHNTDTHTGPHALTLSPHPHSPGLSGPSCLSDQSRPARRAPSATAMVPLGHSGLQGFGLRRDQEREEGAHWHLQGLAQPRHTPPQRALPTSGSF